MRNQDCVGTDRSETTFCTKSLLLFPHRKNFYNIHVHIHVHVGLLLNDIIALLLRGSNVQYCIPEHIFIAFLHDFKT